MSRRSLQRIRVLTQRGMALADARVEARTTKRRVPLVIVDSVTGKRIATLSVRRSRAAKQAKPFGAEARLVRDSRITVRE